MIYIPKICGTCNGSNKALSLVYEIYEREIKKEKPKNIYIYKEILHNPKVISELENLGIKTIDSLASLTEDDILIIRAHGEGKDTYDYLDQHNIEYYDATCPNVLKIHQKILKYYTDGYEIVILGNKNHPEVKGSLGWSNQDGIVVNTIEDIERLSLTKKKFITCQTTFNQEKFAELSSAIQKRFTNLEIIIDNSLCKAVTNICKSSLEVAKKCDEMIVIGGLNSSNTKELENSLKNITNTHKFANIKDFYNYLKSTKLTKEMNIGITGGASTPYKEILNYKYLLEFWLFYQSIYSNLKKGQANFNKCLLDENDENINSILEDLVDLNQDGKYIRGVLIALGEYLSKQSEDLDYLNLAYLYELFQTSILIHDDIIDNAKLRRGKETIPRRICHRYLNKKNDKSYYNDVLKLANSLGICVGDYGFYKANQIMVQSYQNHPNFAKILAFYNDIVIKTIKGEILDITLPFLGKYAFKDNKEEEIIQIYDLKTSWYTITGPFLLGSILGGGVVSDELIEILNKIGYAFQIKDDLMGIFSEEKEIGKSNLSDIEEFKQTILYTHVINTKYKEEFLKYYGKNITANDLTKIRTILKESGTYDYVLNYLNDLYYTIFSSLDESPLADIGKDILKGLLIFINIRDN